MSVFPTWKCYGYVPGIYRSQKRFPRSPELEFQMVVRCCICWTPDPGPLLCFSSLSLLLAPELDSIYSNLLALVEAAPGQNLTVHPYISHQGCCIA